MSEPRFRYVMPVERPFTAYELGQIARESLINALCGALSPEEAHSIAHMVEAANETIKTSMTVSRFMAARNRARGDAGRAPPQRLAPKAAPQPASSEERRPAPKEPPEQAYSPTRPAGIPKKAFLTDEFLHRLPAAKRNTYEIRDTEVPGFGIRIGSRTARGPLYKDLREHPTATFVIRCKDKRHNNKQVNMGLGRYPSVTIAAARVQARKLLKLAAGAVES